MGQFAQCLQSVAGDSIENMDSAVAENDNKEVLLIAQVAPDVTLVLQLADAVHINAAILAKIVGESVCETALQHRRIFERVLPHCL